jgi:hypothetical protein
VHAHEDVVGAVELEDLERLVDDLLVDLVGEVPLEGAAVDLPLAGARDDPDAGDGLLATTGGRAGNGGRGEPRAAAARDAGVGLGGVLGQTRASSTSVCRRSRRSGCCRSSLGHLGDLEGLGLLGSVGVLGAAVDLELGSAAARPRVFLGSMPRTAFSTAFSGLLASSSV